MIGDAGEREREREGGGRRCGVRCVMSASRAAAAVKGAVVFLHGSGDNGANFRAAMSAEPLVRNLQARA